MEQQDLLFNGRLYVDVHTENNPDGEIRIQALHGRTADVFTDALDNGLLTRTQVFRILAESELLKHITDTILDVRRYFVQMQYFGYLRRDPDQEGFDFWLQKIDFFFGNVIRAEMVKAFTHSVEYRQRFGRLE